MRRATALLIAVSTTGCSVIFDGDDLVARASDASPVDGTIDAFIPTPDVNPLELAIDSALPGTLEEGAGCVPVENGCSADSRPVPIVLLGKSFTPTATVTVSDSSVIASQRFEVSAAGDMLALGVVVPVLPDLAPGETRALTITVQQAGRSKKIDIELQGLREVSIPADCTGDADACDVSSLGNRFSRVEITENTTLIGDEPILWSATAEAILGGVVDVSGGNATSGQVAGGPGPGGCGGGASGTAASCGPGGGKQGGNDSGGGGGGNADVGSSGGGDNGGGGGDIVSSADATPLDESAGNGGGGGGESGLPLTNSGGAGGGGGGAFALISEGKLTVADGGGGDARGGAGGPGTGGCALVEASPGGGGGGSGGAIVLRAARLLIDDGAGADRLVATGGAGGREGTDCSAGGAGSPGRIRVDSPADAALPGIASSSPSATRGPVLDPDLPWLVTSPALEVGLIGDIGATYALELDGLPAVEVATAGDRRAAHIFTLEEGINQVCAKVRVDVTLGTQEGIQCYTVAYVPQSSQ